MYKSALLQCSALIYLFITIQTFEKDKKDCKNILYLVLGLLFFLWGTINSLLFYITDPNLVAIIRKFSVFSWGIVYSVLLQCNI